jgi:hypothetical protein
MLQNMMCTRVLIIFCFSSHWETVLFLRNLSIGGRKDGRGIYAVMQRSGTWLGGNRMTDRQDGIDIEKKSFKRVLP